MQNPVYLTETGFKNLKILLERKKQEYAQVRADRQVAFELSGDGWHDNPEFNRQQQMETNLNHQVKELTERLLQAKPITINEHNRPTSHVAIGSWVHITRWNLSTDEAIDEVWEITGFNETNIENKQIGYNAPLAQAIMGLKVGDISDKLTLGSQSWEIEINKLSKTRD